MKATPHDQCCCDICVAARHSLVLRTHPIHSKKNEVPAPAPIPALEALVMLREAKECYTERLAELEAEIVCLEDCI